MCLWEYYIYSVGPICVKCVENHDVNRLSITNVTLTLGQKTSAKTMPVLQSKLHKVDSSHPNYLLTTCIGPIGPIHDGFELE